MASSTKSLSSNWKDLQKRLSHSASPSSDDKVTKTKRKSRTKSRKISTTTSTVRTTSISTSASTSTSLSTSTTSTTHTVTRYLPENFPQDIKPARLLLFDDSKLLSNELADLTSFPPHNDPKKQELGRFVALDCEFVGTGPGGDKSILARVSIVNYFGNVLLDTFVKPTERVTDWRTWVSGVTPRLVAGAPTIRHVQNQVNDILKDRILVGHAVRHDLDVMMLSHPKSDIRDTSLYGPFRDVAKGRTPSLKVLAKHFLRLTIQTGEHSSVEDAQATMLLYRLNRSGIERGYHNVRRGGAKPRQ